MTLRLAGRVLLLCVVALLLGAFARVAAAQTPACYSSTLQQTDSLRAETYRRSSSGAVLAPRASVVRRLANRIDSITVRCLPVDTVPTDTVTPPDTTPPPPSGARRLTLTLSTDTLVPGGRVWVYGKIDSSGVVLADSVGPVTLSDPLAVSVRWGREGRRWVLENPTAATVLAVSLRAGALVATDTVIVRLVAPPPPNPGPPPPAPPASADSALRRIAPWRAPTTAPVLAQIDQIWQQWEPVRWKADTARYVDNYYDRALHYYAHWVRTGIPVYKTRADSMAVTYRRDYLEANNYQASNYWLQLDGVAMHWWVTRDPASLTAVSRAGHNVGLLATTHPSTRWAEARMYARSLQALLLAWQTNAPLPPGVTQSWASRIDAALDHILPLQSADGAWRLTGSCNESLNYMSAMLAHTLARVHDNYRADPRIPGAVQRSVDFLWTQWRGTDAVPSFAYYSAVVTCNSKPGEAEGPWATPDLTGIFAPAFGWMARRDPAYAPKALAVIDGANRGVYPQGSKQWNQWGWVWVGAGYLP